MRSYALVALLATSLLFISADASRQLAQDALSNSNGCLNTIPKCEAGACATRNIMGVARWVCLRCRGGYEPVVTADGQDNIVQCGGFDRTEAALIDASTWLYAELISNLKIRLLQVLFCFGPNPYNSRCWVSQPVCSQFSNSRHCR
jgi:hypothetical protein